MGEWRDGVPSDDQLDEIVARLAEASAGDRGLAHVCAGHLFERVLQLIAGEVELDELPPFIALDDARRFVHRTLLYAKSVIGKAG